MNTYSHPSSTRTVGLIATVLLCSMPGLLKAEESVSTTTAKLDETAEHHGEGKAAAAIGARFTEFAGSAENASALVTGLHDGTAVTLTSTVDGQAVTTEFQPATTKLGYGNAFISLALAQKSLAQAGITQPTPDQIVAALNGGSVTGSDGTAATLGGVLTLRATGEGWGDIARTLGVKLGPIVGQLHDVHNRMERPDLPDRIARVEKPDRGARTPETPMPPKPEIMRRPELTGSHASFHRPVMPPGQMMFRAGKP